MRIVTWNVAGRVARLAEQAHALADETPDVVCLQEVTRRTEPLWRAALTTLGLPHAAMHPLPEGRRLAVLTAAREPLTVEPPPAALPWPERALIAVVGGVTVVNVHSPISSTAGLVKVRTHEALYDALRSRPAPAVLAGDLNTPRRERDGVLLTFAHASNGTLRPERGERWDAAERALIRTLGWTDAFRALHPDEPARSWCWPNGGGYRLDHVLVHGLEPLACRYRHDWREAKLSDHSGLVAHLRT